MADFTSGPWRTQGWVPTWAYIPVKDARHNLVASLYPDAAHNYPPEQVEANARLIAAAPELYADIQWAIDRLSVDGGMTAAEQKTTVIRLTAGLAKARGETP